jgi:hypothetical protein
LTEDTIMEAAMTLSAADGRAILEQHFPADAAGNTSFNEAAMVFIPPKNGP